MDDLKALTWSGLDNQLFQTFWYSLFSSLVQLLH